MSRMRFAIAPHVFDDQISGGGDREYACAFKILRHCHSHGFHPAVRRAVPCDLRAMGTHRWHHSADDYPRRCAGTGAGDGARMGGRASRRVARRLDPVWPCLAAPADRAAEMKADGLIVNTKNQAPNTKNIPNLKPQCSGVASFLGFGIWDFSGAWSLVFGTSKKRKS